MKSHWSGASKAPNCKVNVNILSSYKGDSALTTAEHICLAKFSSVPQLATNFVICRWQAA